MGRIRRGGKRIRGTNGGRTREQSCCCDFCTLCGDDKSSVDLTFDGSTYTLPIFDSDDCIFRLVRPSEDICEVKRLQVAKDVFGTHLNVTILVKYGTATGETFTYTASILISDICAGLGELDFDVTSAYALLPLCTYTATEAAHLSLN